MYPSWYYNIIEKRKHYPLGLLSEREKNHYINNIKGKEGSRKCK
jgi:hypothetical protein